MKHATVVRLKHCTIIYNRQDHEYLVCVDAVDATRVLLTVSDPSNDESDVTFDVQTEILSKGEINA